MKPGESFDDVTQYVVHKKSSESVFCQHGGYCYPRYVDEGGKRIEAIHLTNCKIGSLFSDDKEDLMYNVDVARSKNSASVLRYNDLNNRFIELGLCGACADNVAQFYLKQPQSRCATLAKSALEGNPDATNELRRDPTYCAWKY